GVAPADQTISDRPVEMPILPSGLLPQLLLRPGPRGESCSRERCQIDRRSALENPRRQRVSEGWRDRKPRHVAAAREEKTARSADRPDYVLTVGRHRGNAAAVLADARLRQHRQLLLDVVGVTP